MSAENDTKEKISKKNKYTFLVLGYFASSNLTDKVTIMEDWIGLELKTRREKQLRKVITTKWI